MQGLFLGLTRMDQPIVQVIKFLIKLSLILEFFFINLQGMLAAILSGFVIVQVEMNTTVFQHSRNTFLKKGRRIQNKKVV